MLAQAATALLLMCSSLVYGQNGKITGVVSDSFTGETLIGAYVVYGENKVIDTNFDGQFEIALEYGTYTITVSYVGYSPIEKSVVLDRKSITVNFKLETILLKEAEVVSDIAIERETPVAYSNISAIQLQEQLGSEPIPMILNYTPGVYATTDGSDDSGPGISIRGFKQRNVSVMIDGVPVNDMESGSVFWNNWFGLDLVTQTMQVQRGLGASKLALPAIGGTVNILTQGIEAKRKTSVKQDVGSQGLYRTSIGHTTGRMEGGWGITFAGAYKTDKGFVDNYYSDAWFYYLKVQKELGKHLLSLSVTGSPSKNATRSYRQRIVTFDQGYARDMFTGSDEEYEHLASYNQAYVDLFNDNLNGAEFTAGVDSINNHYGYESLDQFLDEQSGSNFIDTTGIVEKGSTYNIHWGDLNNGILNERQNQYHKPLFNLRHSWAVNEKLFWSNVVYVSVGRGGGSRLNPGLGAGDYDLFCNNIQVNFQRFFNDNTIGGIFGPPIDPVYSDTLLKSGKILRKLFNNHYWIGGLSTFNYKANKKMTFSGGLDVRSYRGEHFAEVFDLLGGDYFVDDDNENESEKSDHVKRVGDKIDYHNDSFVRWGGIFALLEYKSGNWNGFFNLTGVYQGYNRVDYFEDTTGFGGFSESGWEWIPGYTVKVGGNYNINEFHNVFTNLGYLNRTPVFSNVIGFDNNLIDNTVNELISSVELGYAYSRHPITINLNGYYTDWNNRPLDRLLSVEDPDGNRFRANITSMSAVHMGAELDIAYQVLPNVILSGVLSIGDWKWDSSADSLQLINQETNQPLLNTNGEIFYVYYNAKGVAVGDAPQTQIGGSIRWNITRKIYINPRFTYFERHYANFDPFSLNQGNEQRQSWQIPGYGILDIHAGYSFEISSTPLDVRLSVFNVLNTSYISNAQNNEAFSDIYYKDSNRVHAEALHGNFDAASAGVFMGYGIRSNLSIRVRF